MRKRVLVLAVGLALLATVMLGGAVFAHEGGDNDRPSQPGCSEFGQNTAGAAQRFSPLGERISQVAQAGLRDDRVARFHNRRC